MAWQILPKPGTATGPCKTACAHRDCALTRAMAAQRCTECTECGKPIGYGRPFCFADPVDDADHVHELAVHCGGMTGASVERSLAPLAHHACLLPKASRTERR